MEENKVALLAEGVDRNWMLEHRIQKREVALLAEGVDRNIRWLNACGVVSMSPSSRRAWIEIYILIEKRTYRLVALLAEGVDRNSAAPKSP